MKTCTIFFVLSVCTLCLVIILDIFQNLGSSHIIYVFISAKNTMIKEDYLIAIIFVAPYFITKVAQLIQKKKMSQK